MVIDRDVSPLSPSTLADTSAPAHTTATDSLASLTSVVKRAIQFVWLAGVAGLGVFTLAAAGGPGDPSSDGYVVLYAALFAVPGALCLARAWLIARQRLPWALFGAGMLCWAGAQIVYFGAYADQPDAPYPSAVDAFFLTSYVLSIAAVLALIRAGLSHIRKSLWIDAVVGGLAAAAIAAALLVQPILDSTGGDRAGVITNLAYPLMDVVIVALLIAVFTMSNGRLGRVWGVVGLVWLLFAVVDTIFLYQVAAGEYAYGTLLDVGWPALMLLLALAAWDRPTATKAAPDQGWAMLTVTVGFALVGLALIAYDHWHQINDVAAVLAVLTLAAAFVRTTMTFADMRTLAGGRELSLQRALILDAAGEGIVGMDPDGAITFANPAAARMTGYTPEELAGRDLHTTLHHTKPDGSHYPVCDCPIHASLADGTIHHSDADLYWRKDGTGFGVEYTSTPIVDGARIRGAVVVFHDISERQEVERIKDEFTAVVSHELRTPLTSIRGSLGLLESGVLGPLPDKAQRMTQIAVQNTDRLVRLINDILDLERLESDVDHLRDAPCDAAELIARATEAMLPAAVAAEVTLAVDAAPITFEADPDRIIQTLTNLISNAVKFSPAGGTVQITSERRSEDVLFSVSDRGRGVPADKLETIFGRFQQVDSSDSRQSGGTGLGLAICRSIVEQHGGRIWARSEPGEGSTFSFALPLSRDPGDEYLPRPGGELGSVLFCDDNAAILEVTGTALEERGYNVILARSGEEAIERAIAEQPDVILLDLLLPGISGAQTIVALGEHRATCDIPVVVLSVLPRSEEEVGRGLIADWIEKPATSADLFDTLERAIRGRDGTFRVMVVERDPAVAQILSALFERHGVVSAASADGPQTVALCERMSPDLIVMDEGLAAVDGVELKDWLRLHEHLRALPIVAYDAADVQAAERERRAVGAVAQTLTKGQISPEEFQWRVMTLLARPHTQRRTVETKP